MSSTSPNLAPPTVVLTYEDLRAMPEDGRRYEILEGELCVTPAPSITHQRISRNLEFILHRHVTERGLGEILDAPVDVLLDRSTVVQPDLVFVARQRADIIAQHGVEGPPDLIVEILSPSTALRDKGVKQQLYARYGVPHYWCLDPAGRSLTQWVLAQGRYATQGVFIAPAAFESVLFPGLTIELRQVFPDA